ncbi:MAG: hypothetical protein K2G97_03160 [Oscillospiraceae bacterium]|nr:hypothetical protein [Oscillospiraceae bacterium]
MDILEELSNILKEIDIPIQTGVFTNTPPKQYLVLTPIAEWGAFYADNKEKINRQEVRISLFSKINYIKPKNEIIQLLKDSDFSLSDRRYIGREDDTGYYHFAIDVTKDYVIEEE